MDKLQLTGRNLGRVFNSRIGRAQAIQLHFSKTEEPNLKLNTQPKLILGSLQLDMPFTGWINDSYNDLITNDYHSNSHLLYKWPALSVCCAISLGRIHNTSFCSQLTNGSNKLECFFLANFSSPMLCNTLLYWTHLMVMKRMICCEYDPWCVWHLDIESLYIDCLRFVLCPLLAQS